MWLTKLLINHEIQVIEIELWIWITIKIITIQSQTSDYQMEQFNGLKILKIHNWNFE